MCFYCKNETMRSAVTTHVVTLENCVIIVKNVPCEECEQCGESITVMRLRRTWTGLFQKPENWRVRSL